MLTFVSPSGIKPLFYNRLPICGWDRLVNLQGDMSWKILGLFPVMTAHGEHITKFAIGRMQCEMVWLPSVLCRAKVNWNAGENQPIQAHFSMFHQETVLKLSVMPSGALKQVWLPRWGDPDDKGYRYVSFGGCVDRETTFSGFTIPSTLIAGWYFNDDQDSPGQNKFNAEGNFFQVTLDNAKFR